MTREGEITMEELEEELEAILEDLGSIMVSIDKLKGDVSALKFTVQRILEERLNNSNKKCQKESDEKQED